MRETGGGNGGEHNHNTLVYTDLPENREKEKDFLNIQITFYDLQSKPF